MIVHQMLKKIRIEESGDSNVLPGVSMDVLDFNEMNEELIAQGKQPAEGKQVMLGITRHPLQQIPSYPQHPSRRPPRF